MSDTIRQGLIESIHCGVDPHADFDPNGHTWKHEPWDNKRQTFFFDKGIPLVKPDLYVEMGTWFGRSARYVSDLLWNNGVKDPCVLCVDTWLGSTEHWRGRARKRLGTTHNHGYPNFYFQFLANTMNAGPFYRDIIVPFPTTSANAARHLKQQGFESSFIFIDGSHEYEDVYVDLVLCERLLPRDGGIMVCDDVAHYFPGVEKAIKRFMAEREGEYTWLKSGSVVTALVPTKRQDWIMQLKTGLKRLRIEVEQDKAAKGAAKLAQAG